MVVLGLIISAVVWLLSAVSRKGNPPSSMHMINAGWLADAEKFRLVSRWGVTR